jgi:hypothetical protein
MFFLRCQEKIKLRNKNFLGRCLDLRILRLELGSDLLQLFCDQNQFAPHSAGKPNCQAGASICPFAALRAVIYTFISTIDAVMSVTDRTGAFIFHA